MEDESVGKNLAKEAASYLPDLSDKKQKDLENMCSALPCIWSKGKVSPQQNRNINSSFTNPKNSSGYSAFDYQESENLVGKGIVPGLQGKGDLGFSKLVNICKEKFPDKTSCPLECGVSFTGLFCESDVCIPESVREKLPAMTGPATPTDSSGTVVSPAK